MSEDKIEAIFELDHLMEKLILLLSEYNQSFLEHTLNRLDRGLKVRKLQNLFNLSSTASGIVPPDSQVITDANG